MRNQIILGDWVSSLKKGKRDLDALYEMENLIGGQVMGVGGVQSSPGSQKFERSYRPFEDPTV